MTNDEIAHLRCLSDAIEERVSPEAAELVRRACEDAARIDRLERNLSRMDGPGNGSGGDGFVVDLTLTDGDRIAMGGHFPSLRAAIDDAIARADRIEEVAGYVRSRIAAGTWPSS